MEETQELAERPVKKARTELQESGSHSSSQTTSEADPASEQHEASSHSAESLAAGKVKMEAVDTGDTGTVLGNVSSWFTGTVMTCTSFDSRTPSEYTSHIYTTKPYPHIISSPIAQTTPSYAGQSQYPALQPSVPYAMYPQASQTYGLPPFGTMWPGVGSDRELIRATPLCQPGPLSYTSTFTSTQPSSAQFTCPVEGTSFTASSTFSTASSNTAGSTSISTAANVSEQDYPTYTVLGQTPFSPNYLSSGYGSSVAAPSSAIGTILASPSFPSEKPHLERLHTAEARTTPVGKDLDEQARRNLPGKSRKGRKTDPSCVPDSELERVFLWDLDETIIVFHSLLTGSYAQKYGKDPTVAINLGLQMEEMIFELADTHLFFNDLEECDQVHVDDVASDDNGQDLSNYSFATDGFTGPASSAGRGSGPSTQGGVDWIRKLAFRYRRVRELYNTHKSDIGGLLSPLKRESLARLRSEIEAVTDSWLGTAVKSLHHIQSRRNSVNILVTTTQLVPALAKVLLYGLGEVFPIENVYSATKIGKESCFERIVSRFGRKVTYVVIGDGRDEEIAAKQPPFCSPKSL
ncbi:eyes absent homolog 3 isoform X3 [Latimeria chalumnae]|uniref:eyes absent homolog 3 isoform X3 n=1 Tax=Latimeria chalumnae TaxID=7897 RepID=UPI0003C10971|nr:PREDICTED: eyes absent homolog 3 isoform X3 [Latimeria chalumnae]|eukprot:XP_006011801.1 PREDICTED: eyes absent homolog 3 isoform X3 [Latimeria chalumnae]